MAISDKDREFVAQVAAGTRQGFGVAGDLEFMLRFSKPGEPDRADIQAAIGKLEQARAAKAGGS